MDCTSLSNDESCVAEYSGVCGSGAYAVQEALDAFLDESLSANCQ